MRASVAPCVAALLTAGFSPLAAQYQSHAELSRSLSELSRAHGGDTELITVATSPGGRSVQALRVGPSGQPALLVVAGADGPQLVGSSIAMAAAQSLLAAQSPDSLTVWFIPRLNPDAAEAMFGRLKWERITNDAAGYDKDHDQRLDEDGVEDLNGDALITKMLLEDPAGRLMADSLEPRLFRVAEADRGETGRYLLVSEGRDDDGDLAWNEDGPGGIDVNQNFSYNYEHHGPDTGLDPFAAPEVRGLADFLIAHPEVAAVYVIGPQDNLLEPWENGANQGVKQPDGSRAQEGTSQGGPLHSIMRQDEATFANVGRRFRDITGLEKGPASAPLAGDVLSWAYYHFGRWAFGSRGWWVPTAPKDTSAGSGRTKEGGDEGQLGADRNALKWFAAHGIEAFVPWTTVTVPGNEGRSVQVGGFKPGVLINPPEGAEFDSTTARHTRFITSLAGMLPRLALRDVKATRLGNGMYRLEARVINTGALPTTTALAARLRNPRRVRVDLGAGDATLVSGDAVQLVGPIPPGGSGGSELSWTVAAPAGTALTVTAGSPVTGTATQTVTLR